MAGKRLALLIANADYEHAELRKLKTPHGDVRALETLLTRPDIGGYQAQVLIDETKAATERAIDRMLVEADREDTVLIFFAGHGLKRENGKLYFAAVTRSKVVRDGSLPWRYHPTAAVPSRLPGTGRCGSGT
jgi:uncharacterized caspase-like protein